MSTSRIRRKPVPERPPHVWVAAQREGLADDFWIAVEASCPKVITDDNDPFGVGKILFRGERAASKDGRAEAAKIVRGYLPFMTSHAVVHVSGIRKTYGATVAIDEVSFEVNEGEIFGLIGPNGAGKTTTMECVEGLRTPD